MRILYVCHRIPYPPDKGDKIRAFHQLRAMGARHEVDLFTLADGPVDPAYEAALGEHCTQVTVAPLHPKVARLRALPYLLTRTPLTLPCFYSRELETAIRTAIRQRSYDRIFIYCSAIAQYVEHVDDIPIVTDLVDVDSDKWMQYAAKTGFPFSAVYRREANRLRAYERKICEKSACVVVSTEREAQLLRKISSAALVRVVPNGVDTEFFHRPEGLPEPAAPGIVFTGDMSYFPNADAVTFFAFKVLPLIRESVPRVRFMIVGRSPGRSVRYLRRVKGVEVTGFVPDVRTYLARAQVSVAPFTIAAGIQNKILEAMSYGLPVVAFSRAVQGLSKGVAGAVETAESAEEMARKIILLLQDRDLAHQKGMEGRQRVTAEYRWDEALAGLLQVVEDPAGAAHSPVRVVGRV